MRPRGAVRCCEERVTQQVATSCTHSRSLNASQQPPLTLIVASLLFSLSQDPSTRVLLLEAGTGDYKNKFINIPAGILRLFKSKFDWQHETKGDKDANGRNIFLARGKVLGGSSCTNVLLHHRGSKQVRNERRRGRGAKRRVLTIEHSVLTPPSLPQTAA